MIEQDIRIRAADADTDAVFVRPDGSGPWPGVLLYTDIVGIRDAYRQSARRLAGEGYSVLMPHVFYRTGKLPVFSSRPDFNDERTRQRLAEISGPLTPEAMERDASAYMDILSAQDSVRPGAVGVVGYCFTGAMALRTAAARADKIAAAASFHGGGLFTVKPTSPHLVLPRVKARLYFGHAVEDRSMPQEAITQLDNALKAWGGKYESEVYEGARHGWTTLDASVYNPPQADRAFAKLTALLAETSK
jgi:carboxymethylenebutenolidase